MGARTAVRGPIFIDPAQPTAMCGVAYVWTHDPTNSLKNSRPIPDQTRGSIQPTDNSDCTTVLQFSGLQDKPCSMLLVQRMDSVDAMRHGRSQLSTHVLTFPL